MPLLVIGGIGLALLLYAWLVEPNRVRVVRYDLPMAGLPAELAGLVIVHLSDLHGKLFPPGYLEEKINPAGADLVLVTGDMFERKGDVEPVLAFLQGIEARSGVFFVSGNNEHGNRLAALGMNWLRQQLTEAGITVLDNRHVRRQIRGQWLCLAGVDDPTLGQASLSAACKGAPAGDLKILLSHSPDIHAAASGYGISLTVAGHTHGGQVCLPWYGALVTHTRYGRRCAAGVYHLPPGILAVTRGLGTSILPIRFCCPPEVAVYTLHPAEQEG